MCDHVHGTAHDVLPIIHVHGDVNRSCTYIKTVGTHRYHHYGSTHGGDHHHRTGTTKSILDTNWSHDYIILSFDDMLNTQTK